MSPIKALYHHSLWLSLLLVLLASSLASAANITVDDSSPDIRYSPPNTWLIGQSCGAPCDYSPPPDATQAFNQTWQDGTFKRIQNEEPLEDMFANFTFTGTAVYVFAILPMSQGRPNGFAQVDFFIDDQKVAFFKNDPPHGSTYQYNRSILSIDSLSAAEHTLSIKNGDKALNVQSTLLLDYIVYTTPSGSASSDSGPVMSSKRTSIGAIVGGTIGAIVFLLLLGLGFFLWRRHKRHIPLLPTHTINLRRLLFTFPSLTNNTPRQPADQNRNQNQNQFAPAMMIGQTPGGRPLDLLSGGSSSGSNGRRAATAATRATTPQAARIQEWQQRTAAEAEQPAAAQGPFPVPPPQSDVISSYWDDSTGSYRSWNGSQAPAPNSPPQPPPPPLPPVAQSPRAPIRRLTVMNN